MVLFCTDKAGVAAVPIEAMGDVGGGTTAPTSPPAVGVSPAAAVRGTAASETMGLVPVAAAGKGAVIGRGFRPTTAYEACFPVGGCVAEGALTGRGGRRFRRPERRPKAIGSSSPAMKQ